MRNHKSLESAPYFWSALLFVAYLAILPTIVSFLTPCMHPNIGSSYPYQSCNTVFALDRFVILALVGGAAALLTSFFKDSKRAYRSLIISALVLSVSTIAAYYLYAPQAERAIRNAPILLDSLR